jgi:hypothetical protein
MIVALATTEETFVSSLITFKEEIATVKQYQGTTSSDRDPQGVTSAQPPAPLPRKEISDRKGQGQKKIKASKAGHGK